MLRFIHLSSKVVLSVFIIITVLASFHIAFRTTQMSKTLLSVNEGGIEALSFSNELPGAHQGERQPQAVWCCGSGWIVREGCCYGSTNCSDIGCPTICFSCDGNTWYNGQ